MSALVHLQEYSNYVLVAFVKLWVNNICVLGHSASQIDLSAMFVLSAACERCRWKHFQESKAAAVDLGAM